MKYAVSRKKMSPVGEYASSLVFLTLPLSIFNQTTTLGIVSEKGGIVRVVKGAFFVGEVKGHMLRSKVKGHGPLPVLFSC